jgi:hypothetical protein
VNQPSDPEIEIKVQNEPQQKEVSIEIDDKGEVIKQEPPKKEEPKYVRVEDLESIRKAQNASFYRSRQIEDRINEIAKSLEENRSAQVTLRDNKNSDDPWEKKLQENWKGTVEELAELKFRELEQRREQERLVQAERERKSNLLNENKKKVIERHPELFDEESEKAAIYKQVLESNKDYLTDPFGPVLAMRDMEDALREQGKWVDPVTKNIVDREVSRQARTGAGQLPNGTHRASATKHVLSKDDKEFCDQNGINYESYLKSKYAANRGGVEA